MDDLIDTAIKAAQARMGGDGVWRHSKNAAYFVFCVGQDPVRIAAFLTWAFHEKVNVKPLVGKYEGKTERSFVANYNDFLKIEPFLANEESILIVDRYDARDIPRARLEYQDGRVLEMGRLVVTDKDTALGYTSWTFDPATGHYFITKEL